jgi:hypothetical protein
MAQSCEVSASPQGAEETSPLLENKSIGISQTLSNNICPNMYGSVEVYDDMFGVHHGVVRARKCGRWDCPVCGNERVKKIRKRLKGALYYRFGEVQKRGESDGWKYLKFLTLTCYHNFDTPQEAYKVMSEGWNKLLTAMKRKFGNIEVFKVVEAHKDGYPHFHSLLWTIEFIPFDWIQEKWVKYGVGKFVNISNKTKKFENIKHVVNYVTKYLMKSVGDAVSWFKRWSQSRGFLMKPEKIKWWTGYHLNKLQDVEWLFEEVQEAGHWVEWHKDMRGFTYLTL